MSEQAIQTVRDFCAAWSRLNVDELVGYFADDAVYHNIPMRPMQGKAAIAKALSQFVVGSRDVEFEMVHIGAAGDVVFTERVDRFTLGEKQIALPVAGVFELKDGKITAWRDYFDVGMWNKQSQG